MEPQMGKWQQQQQKVKVNVEVKVKVKVKVKEKEKEKERDKENEKEKEKEQHKQQEGRSCSGCHYICKKLDRVAPLIADPPPLKLQQEAKSTPSVKWP